MESMTSTRQDEPLAIPIGQMSVLEDLVRQLDDMIRSARNMPLSSSALIDRQAVLDVVETLKRSIPEEIARARTVIRDRDELLTRAHSQAERIVERAKEQRKLLVSQTEIVSAATRHAEHLISEAEATGERITAQTDRYVEGKLATFEVALQRTLAAVERGRAQIAGRTAADDLVDEGFEEG